MRQRRRSTGTARIAAFIATLALVLQAGLAGAATPVQRDLFGNVICADGSGGQKPGDSGQHDTHLPNCCMLSCGGAFQAFADLPAFVEWQPKLLAERTVTRPQATIVLRHDRRTPANPRAPPAAA